MTTTITATRLALIVERQATPPAEVIIDSPPSAAGSPSDHAETSSIQPASSRWSFTFSCSCSAQQTTVPIKAIPVESTPVRPKPIWPDTPGSQVSIAENEEDNPLLGALVNRRDKIDSALTLQSVIDIAEIDVHGESIKFYLDALWSGFSFTELREPFRIGNAPAQGNPLHPLTFMRYVLSHNDVRKSLLRLKDIPPSIWHFNTWNAFVMGNQLAGMSGWATELKRAYKENPYDFRRRLESFCAVLNRYDEYDNYQQKIEKYCRRGNAETWKTFVDDLLSYGAPVHS